MNLHRVRLLIGATLFAGVLVLIPAVSHAATLPFTNDLSYGMKGSVAVMQLQNLLRQEGYFNGDSTGNFLSLTRGSVKEWQAAKCVPATGYFGPLSRQAATSGGFCAPAAPTISAAAHISSGDDAGDDVTVMIDGVSYVRTIHGLVRISSGKPKRHVSDHVSSPPPALTYVVTPSGDGNVSMTPDTPQTVEDGSVQSFVVTANSGYTLSNTVGGTCTGGSWSGSTYTTGVVHAHCTVSFSATPDTYALTVTKTGPGSGNITSTPTGIACGSTCTATYSSGTVVTLTAFSTYGFFNGWSGGGCSGLGSCVVTMDAAKAVTATFQTLDSA